MTDDLVGRLRRWHGHRKELDAAIGDEPHPNTMLLSEAAARIEALEAALRTAHDLLMCVEQTSSNVWWVNADDPETAVCDTFSVIEAALTPEAPHAD